MPGTHNNSNSNRGIGVLPVTVFQDMLTDALAPIQESVAEQAKQIKQLTAQVAGITSSTATQLAKAKEPILDGDRLYGAEAIAEYIGCCIPTTISYLQPGGRYHEAVCGNHKKGNTYVVDLVILDRLRKIHGKSRPSSKKSTKRRK